MSLKYLLVNIYWFCKFTKNIYNIVYLAALKNLCIKIFIDYSLIICISYVY